ncbi:unnamed protein product [Sphagnum tenellum]
MFKKATRSQVKLKLALAGPSGSGKSYSALALATGLTQALGGKIAAVDTENNSLALYSDKFAFDSVCMNSPYTTEKYIRAMQEAEAQGYTCLILDSLSAQWAGEGGILDRKARLDSRGGNSFTNWNQMTPEQELFKAAILKSNIHLICTMRSKQDYILQEDRGKQRPVKIGMAPIQRDDLSYEFSVVFDIASDHSAIASKDRTGLFSVTTPFTVTDSTGALLAQWLSQNQDAPTTTNPQSDLAQVV